MGIDAERVEAAPTPSQLLAAIPDGDTWTSMTRRSVARLRAFFLLSEDPQRRLDARKVNTLAHQVSLVRHVLDTPALKRVLIADEVGLGKTVEVGLLIQELLAANPRLRVLYLAPARLGSKCAAGSSSASTCRFGSGPRRIAMRDWKINWSSRAFTRPYTAQTPSRC